MTCANCAQSIRKYLEKKGIEQVYVDFASSEVQFEDTGDLDIKSIIKGIEGLGYQVNKEKKDNRQKKNWSFSNLEMRFFFTVPFTAVLLSAMFLNIPFLHNPYFQLALCIPVYLSGMLYFGKSGFGSLKSGLPNMDVLITIGASAAFIYSLTGTLMELGPSYLFYETAATIITLVMLGNVIEHRSVKQTTNALKELTELQPDHAKLVYKDPETGNNLIMEIHTESILPGNLLQVNEGDKVPVDGKVLNGNATLDESMITGESLPIKKEKGDPVIGGTIIKNGQLLIQSTVSPDKTVLANIIEMVKQARADKPPIQRFADRISGIFVPAVLAMAILTFSLGYFGFDLSIKQALLNSIAVLVIACPCAMGLATPTAVMVGLGKAAKNGILIKGGATLETLSKVKTLVFDKTGTLTTGEFHLDNVVALQGDETYILDLVYNLEKYSSHPIAKALTDIIKPHSEIIFENIEEIKGIGIQGTDSEGDEYAIGSNRLLHTTEADDHDIYIMKNRELLGWMDIRDEIVPHTREIIQELKEKGYRTLLLSGDRVIKCRSVAEEIDIDEYYAEKLPSEKLKIIKELSAHGPVAMIGDGINDAPALTQADVGISLGNATQIAIHSADVVLLNGHINKLPETLALTDKTVLTIKQNLFWAFFYNTLAIPIAAIGLLNPMIAALSMAFSDVIVIGNSIRLRYKRIR